MLDSVIIIGVVMATTEAAKKHIPKELIFIPVLVLAAVLNGANAYFFGDPTAIKMAVAQGIELGAITSGIYSLGKAALGKS